MIYAILACVICALIPLSMGVVFSLGLKACWHEMTALERLFYGVLIAMCAVGLISIVVSGYTVIRSAP